MEKLITETWESIPEQIKVLGTWSGQEDALMSKLRQLGYTCRVQTAKPEDTEELKAVMRIAGVDEAEVEQPRPDMLAVLGCYHWETYIIGKGDKVYLRGNGNLSYGSEDFLTGNFRKVTDTP